MPVVTAYSETSLAAYQTAVLGEVASLLGWDSSSVQVAEARNDALLEYGETDVTAIAGSTNLRRLRALARRAVWRAVVQATAGKYDFRDSDATFTRSQIHEQAQNALERAEAECLEFSPTYAVSVVSIKRPHDPYAVVPDVERTLP